MERLDGSVAAAVPLRAEKKKGLLGALLPPLLRVTKGASVEMGTQSEFTQMVNQAGGPARLPAPAELLDAVEVWVLLFLVVSLTASTMTCWCCAVAGKTRGSNLWSKPVA
jgi:hypothetical protein